MQHRREIGAERVTRRRQPEDQAGDERQSECEQHHAQVDVDVEIERDGHWELGQRQQGDEPVGQRHRHHGRRDEQHHRFDEQLRDQAAPSGANREARRHFATPCRGARQQHAGDVAARDRQQRPGQREQEADEREKRRAHRARNAAHRCEVDRVVLVRVRPGFLVGFVERVQLGLSLAPSSRRA